MPPENTESPTPIETPRCPHDEDGKHVMEINDPTAEQVHVAYCRHCGEKFYLISETQLRSLDVEMYRGRPPDRFTEP